MTDNRRREITITTGSRLHFGLLRSAAPFGGVGVMIDRPQSLVRVCSSDHWQCDRNHASRIVPIAKRLIRWAGIRELPRCNVQIFDTARPHCGLGSGTQLSLAVAEAISRFVGLDIPPLTLATTISGRGKRSAVGIHGYFQGGLIHEQPQTGQQLNPVKRRVKLPTQWRVALLVPAQPQTDVSGENESDYFSKLGNDAPDLVEQLRCIIKQQLIPAAVASDFASFCQAVTAYNESSGQLFRSVQGGAFNGQQVTDLVAKLRADGQVGVGQSSWGPGVFAWFESSQSLDSFLATAKESRSFQVVTTARPRNESRTVTIG